MSEPTEVSLFLEWGSKLAPEPRQLALFLERNFPRAKSMDFRCPCPLVYDDEDKLWVDGKRFGK